MRKITRDGIAAASATYRTVTNVVAQRLKVRADHIEFPKEDFFRRVGLIEPKSRARAMKFYDLGVRRGMKQATDWFTKGTLPQLFYKSEFAKVDSWRKGDGVRCELQLNSLSQSQT